MGKCWAIHQYTVVSGWSFELVKIKLLKNLDLYPLDIFFKISNFMEEDIEEEEEFSECNKSIESELNSIEKFGREEN